MQDREYTGSIVELNARGLVQTSRKYRGVAIPPPRDKALEMLSKYEPLQYERLIDHAVQLLTHMHGEHYTLTPEQFNEWLVLNDRRPDPVGPPEGGGCPECRTWTNNHARGCSRGKKRQETQ